MYMNNKLTNTIDKFLDGLVPYYIYTIVCIHISYILLFIGLVQINTSYLSILDTTIQFFVCLFLIIRFNPFRKHDFKEQDSHIIFGSATFLLLNLGFIKIFNQYFSDIPSKVKDKITTMGKEIIHP